MTAGQGELGVRNRTGIRKRKETRRRVYFVYFDASLLTLILLVFPSFLFPPSPLPALLLCITSSNLSYPHTTRPGVVDLSLTYLLCLFNIPICRSTFISQSLPASRACLSVSSSPNRSIHHSSSYRSGTDPISPISNQRVAQRANANPRPSTNFRRSRPPTTAIRRHQRGLPHLRSSVPHSNPNLAQDGISIERRR